jgi:hypothetical protein
VVVEGVSGRGATRTEDIEAFIAGLAKLRLDELRDEWVRQVRRPAPGCRSADVLRGLLAWTIQAKADGGISADTRRHLRELDARGRPDGHFPRRKVSRLMPGTVLTREWHGALHKVFVLEDGFAYNGARFDDLSSIARAITGARWSGPRFFGLKRAEEDRTAMRGRRA